MPSSVPGRPPSPRPAPTPRQRRGARTKGGPARRALKARPAPAAGHSTSGPPTAAAVSRSPAELVCSGLDALVQAALKADPTAPYLARRLFETWKTLGDRVVQVGCGELEMHGEIGLRANSRRGGWILPAHLAGLRRVTMLEWAAFRDVERLGHVLALRNTDEQALHQLWKRLWSGDAPGFALELEEPVHEARDHVEAATSPACRQLQFEVAVEAW